MKESEGAVFMEGTELRKTVPQKRINLARERNARRCGCRELAIDSQNHRRSEGK